MNGYTLISCIGTGMYKKEGGYRPTTYQFPGNGKKFRTTIFLEAIFKTEYRPIKKVIVVGTRTSSWDMLIADLNNNEDLFFKIHGECRNKEKGIGPDSVKELESKLPGWYNNIPFKIVVHTNEINHENVENIFKAYGEIPDLLEPNTDILFDISHGFRSMHLLLFQSLQLNASKISGRRVELIYGEYIEDEDISYVRDLSQYWEYYEISSAKKLFEEKLDGRLLAEKIKQDWESGEKFLNRLSDIVECNFSLQIPYKKEWNRDAAINQLKNALKDFNKTGKPKWIIEVWDKLDEMYKRLSVKENEKYPVAKTVWEYSKILREKNLITQAVIALHVVVETAIAEKYDPEKIGDYSWFNGYYDKKKKLKIEGIGDKKLKKIYKKSNKIGMSLGKLEGLRDRIAHGGGKDKKENFPHLANIDGILKSIDDVIQEFFTILDQDD